MILKNSKIYHLYIIIFSICILTFNCKNEKHQDIIVVDEFTNKTYSDMVDILGPPIDKTTYTIENAPTKSWNHTELFSKYPKGIKNNKVKIMEVIWDTGDFSIFACYHFVNGVNRCLVAKKIRKGVEF